MGLSRAPRQDEGGSSSAVLLRKIVPARPVKLGEMTELQDDLNTMRCLGLLTVPWTFRDEAMVRELRDGASNKFDNTCRAKPSEWSVRKWREAYDLPEGGSGWTGRKENFIGNRFANAPDPKDGYPITACTDPRARRVLEFIVPIIYPDKPNRVTLTVGNTVFGALYGGREVNWGLILHLVVEKLVAGVGSKKGSPLSPFLYHLYKREQLLTPVEERAWAKEEALLKHGDSETESEPEEDIQSDPGSPDREKQKGKEATEETVTETTPVGEDRKKTGRKQTTPNARAEPGSDPCPAGPSSGYFGKDPFRKLFADLEEVRNAYCLQEEILRDVAGIVKQPDLSQLKQAVGKAIADPKRIRELEDEVDRLENELGGLQAKNKGLEGDLRRLATERTKMAEALEKERKKYLKAQEDFLMASVSVTKIRGIFREPGEVLNQAELFGKDLVKHGVLSGSRIMNILVDFGARMEETLVEIRAVMERIPSPLRTDWKGPPGFESSEGTPEGKAKQQQGESGKAGPSNLADPGPVPANLPWAETSGADVDALEVDTPPFPPNPGQDGTPESSRIRPVLDYYPAPDFKEVPQPEEEKGAAQPDSRNPVETQGQAVIREPAATQESVGTGEPAAAQVPVEIPDPGTSKDPVVTEGPVGTQGQAGTTAPIQLSEDEEEGESLQFKRKRKDMHPPPPPVRQSGRPSRTPDSGGIGSPVTPTTQPRSSGSPDPRGPRTRSETSRGSAAKKLKLPKN